MILEDMFAEKHTISCSVGIVSWTLGVLSLDLAIFVLKSDVKLQPSITNNLSLALRVAQSAGI